MQDQGLISMYVQIVASNTRETRLASMPKSNILPVATLNAQLHHALNFIVCFQNNSYIFFLANYVILKTPLVHL